jgi:hypothetical protein
MLSSAERRKLRRSEDAMRDTPPGNFSQEDDFGSSLRCREPDFKCHVKRGILIENTAKQET